MKKIIWLWIGILFIIIDLPVPTGILFPAYEAFVTEAPVTVNMIIHHLIGDTFYLDLFSDVIGYLILIIISFQLMNDKKSFRKVAFSSCIACGFLIMYKVAPFIMNGQQRYYTGFFLFLIYAAVKTYVTVKLGLSCCNLSECLQNHAWNNVVMIFILAAAFSGLVRDVTYFYNLDLISVAYYSVQIGFTAVYSVMYYKRRDFICLVSDKKACEN